MDPDVTLRELRTLSRKMMGDYQQDDSNGIDQDDANRLAELVDSLDGWIANGGFLPEAWSRKG